jgi:hypothetical protein
LNWDADCRRRRLGNPSARCGENGLSDYEEYGEKEVAENGITEKEER